MKKAFLLFSLLILVLNVFSQNVKKGFKNLDKSEFNEAKIIFEEVLKGNNKDILANYGLAILNSNSLYPEKDFFKAYFYINTTDTLFNNADIKDQGKVDKYLTKDTILYFKEKIESKLLEFVGKENNLEVTDKFLSECKNSQHYSNIVLLKYQQEYKLALTTNTIESFETFISKFPKAIEIQDAQTNIHILAFAKAKLQNTEDALNDFIKKYPSANQLNEAIELRNAVAFENVKKTNTVNSLNDFIEKYPSAKQLNEAIELRNTIAFENVKKANTIESYGQFIEQYKTSKQLPEATLLLYNLKFELAKNSKSALALKKFINDCPAASQVAEAKKMYLEIAELIPFRQGNNWGYSDEKQNILIEPTFDSVTIFKGNYTVVMNNPNSYILIDRLGNHLTKKAYSFIDSICVGGLLRVKYNNLYGFIDTTGIEKIIPTYTYCSNFEKGFAKVIISSENFSTEKFSDITASKCGHTDYKMLYDENIEDFRQNWKCGLINPLGKLIFDTKYFDIQICGKIFWCSYDGKKWFLLDKTETQISKEYDNLLCFNEGVFNVNNGGYWVNIIGPDYLEGGKFGFVDTTGLEIVPLIYEYANCFSEGLAYVELEQNKQGFIDKKNNVKIFFNDLKGRLNEKRFGYYFVNGIVKLTRGSKQDDNEDGIYGSTIGGWFCIDKAGNNIQCRK